MGHRKQGPLGPAGAKSVYLGMIPRELGTRDTGLSVYWGLGLARPELPVIWEVTCPEPWFIHQENCDAGKGHRAPTMAGESPLSSCLSGQ